MSKRAFYTGVTPEAYNELKSKLQTYGMSLQGDSGRTSEKGVQANYNYNPEAKSLEISDLSVGFPASMMINSDSLVQRISEMISRYGGRSEA
ncbi:hypothetical protein [uncultured Pontibacter sp.]|uniref:hypothetical protein n=1 Tax=uncultured Pontibacter sp. TaxID=453356 RepID=UPI0026097F5E|nr:hypothetical protein [uncultured Pontibacter sp.]